MYENLLLSIVKLLPPMIDDGIPTGYLEYNLGISLIKIIIIIGQYYCIIFPTLIYRIMVVHSPGSKCSSFSTTSFFFNNFFFLPAYKQSLKAFDANKEVFTEGKHKKEAQKVPDAFKGNGKSLGGS